MKCPKCGSQNDDDAKLCYRCYAPLKASQDRSRLVTPSVKHAVTSSNRRYGRPLIYVSIILVLTGIGGFIATRTFLHKDSHKAKVYEANQESEREKETIEEVSDLFTRMDEALKKDEMIGAVKLFSKAYRELFNSRSMQERLVILASMKIGTGGFTDCETAVKTITFQDREKTSARVLVFSKCRNPSTENTMAQEFTWPIVKEEDGWKIDMMAFMKEFDERLKAK